MILDGATFATIFAGAAALGATGGGRADDDPEVLLKEVDVASLPLEESESDEESLESSLSELSLDTSRRGFGAGMR